jgi:hypothetical protein
MQESAVEAERSWEMADKATGYGGKWKRWLAIYAVVGVIAYLVIYLVFFHHGGSGGGLY